MIHKRFIGMLFVIMLLFLTACETQEVIPIQKVSETPTPEPAAIAKNETVQTTTTVPPAPAVNYVKSSEKYYAAVGDTFEDKTHKIKVVNINDGAIAVEVNGERQIINDGSSKDFADGFTVKVSELFYDIDKTGRSVMLTFPDARSS